MEKELKVDKYGHPGKTFLAETGTELHIKFAKHDKYFSGDEESRDIYDCTFERGPETYTFQFGQSIANEGTPPTKEEVLGCIEFRVPDSYADFCNEYGYDANDKESERIYNAVKDQAEEMESMFSSDELEMLAEVRG